MIFGVDEVIGVGGVNVLIYVDFVEDWMGGFLKLLLVGVGMWVLFCRILWVGDWVGELIEDFGVVCDEEYKLICDDLLNGNVDLLVKVG